MEDKDKITFEITGVLENKQDSTSSNIMETAVVISKQQCESRNSKRTRNLRLHNYRRYQYNK